MLCFLLACSESFLHPVRGPADADPVDTAVDETGTPYPPADSAPPADTAPPDTAPPVDTGGAGLVTITWTTPGAAPASSMYAVGTGAATWDEAASWWEASTADSGASITFQLEVPPGGAVRYSVEAVVDGRVGWSCESTSTDEADDALRGTHTVTYDAPDGARCALVPAIFHKSAGTADGCEAAVFAVSCA